MANPPKRKGTGYENEIRDKHISLGIKAARVPRSGAEPGYPGDVTLELPRLHRVLGECKRRRGPGGFRTIQRWLGSHDCLFTRGDREETLVHMRWSFWERILKALQEKDDD